MTTLVRRRAWVPSHVLHAVWLTLVVPWLLLDLDVLLADIRTADCVRDPPNDAGIAAVVGAFLPAWLVCATIMLALCFYVAISGGRVHRIRIAAWLAVATAYVALAPRPATYRSCFSYDAIEVAWLASLALMAIAFSVHDVLRDRSTTR